MKEFIGKIIVFAAPSGSGKTTIVKQMLKTFDNVEFSISATTRLPRETEEHGIHYYFLSLDEFQQKLASKDFVEYEEVYEGLLYGTLKSELERLWKQEKHILFDIDVKGALAIKEIFKEKVLTIFVKPPSLEELERRLRNRGLDDEESIQKRVAKFSEEMKFIDKFDYVLLNNDLNKALEDAKMVIQNFIK